MWWHRIHLRKSKIKLDRKPRSYTNNHRKKRWDRMDFFYHDRSSQRNKCSCKSYFVSIFYHFEYPCLFVVILIRDKCHNHQKSPKYWCTSKKKQFFTSKTRKGRLQDILSKKSRWSKERPRSGRHDRREESSEKHHLKKKGCLFKYECRQNSLSISCASKKIWCDHKSRVSKKDRDKCKEYIETSPDDCTSWGIFLTISWEYSLEHILLWNRAKPHCQNCWKYSNNRSKSNPFCSKEWKFSILYCPRNHRCGPSSLIWEKPCHGYHTNKYNNHLEKICHCDRPHPSEYCIYKDNDSPNYWPLWLGEISQERAFWDNIENESQCNNLCWYPSDIRNNDHEWSKEFDCASILETIEVTQRLNSKFVEWASEKESYEYETQSGSKWIRQYPRNSFFKKSRWSPEYRLRTKPCRECRSNYDIKRKSSSCKDVVIIIFYLSTCIESDSDRKSNIDNNPKWKAHRRKIKK